MLIGHLHLHVDGDGYFRFARGAQAVYSTDAVLTTSSGILSSQDGYPLLPQIHVPSDGVGVKVAIDGTVTVSGRAAGRIVLALFGSAALARNGSYYTASARSTIGYPGDGVFGIIRTISGGKPSGAPMRTTQRQGAGLTVEVRLRNEIDKPDILLGDIADFSGSNAEQQAVSGIDLGATPVFGAQRGITRSYILATLRSQGLDVDNINIICPIGANVVRRGQKVDEDALVPVALAAAKAQLGIDFAMRSARPIADFMVATGQLAIVAKDVVSYGDGATVSVEIDVDGTEVTRRTITLLPTVAIPQVRSGDPLKVRIIKNGATVEVSGKVRTGGRIGGTVTVETDGGASFTGQLKSLSIVEVKL